MQFVPGSIPPYNPVWLIFTITLLSHFTEKIFILWCKLSCFDHLHCFFLSSPEHSSQPGFPHRLKAAQTEHFEQTLQKLYVSC